MVHESLKVFIFVTVEPTIHSIRYEYTMTALAHSIAESFCSHA
jgi:hypothetical protein